MGALLVPFVGMAARHHNGVTCLNGMRRMAERLHPHGAKITWLVSPESAAIAARELTEWHNAYGDDAAVASPDTTYGVSQRIAGAYEDKKAQLAKAREGVRRALPWATLSVLAGDHQDPEIVRLCADLGFEGLWGFCWEQIEVDQITDRGCPWGFYYMHPDDRLRPAEGQSVIAMEWTSRDLLKAFHSQNPCLYSTDVNDVARGGICSWENIDYLKGMADNYIRNTRYNEQVIFLVHQEGHEMERHEGWLCYTDEDILEGAIMLEELAKHVKPRAQFVTLDEAAKAYRAQNTHTASSHMLWEDTPHPDPNPDFCWNMCTGPWPKTFLHYDRGAQMMFVHNQVQPACIRNYARPWDTQDYYAEPRIPRPRLIHNTRFNWSREIKVAVTASRAIPYGFALWGDYSLYQIAEAPELIEGKILPRELLFLRYDLQPGENEFTIRLSGK